MEAPCGRPAPSGRSRGQAGLPAHKQSAQTRRCALFTSRYGIPVATRITIQRGLTPTTQEKEYLTADERRYPPEAGKKVIFFIYLRLSRASSAGARAVTFPLSCFLSQFPMYKVLTKCTNETVREKSQIDEYRTAEYRITPWAQMNSAGNVFQNARSNQPSDLAPI